MDALQKTSTFNLIPRSAKIVIGLSGGPDSVFLLHQLVAIRQEWDLTLIAAHLDHEWRTTSHQDLLFCKKLCESLQVQFIGKKASELDHGCSYNGSQEELGRTLRHFFFKEVMREEKATHLTLAHHQDDQYETFFINLIRGTTITGLCGMKPIDGYTIRPLLAFSKSEIVVWLTERAIPFLEDPTNSSDLFLRNRIRNHLLPALTHCDPRSLPNLKRLIFSLQETEDVLTVETQRHLAEVTDQKTLLLTPFFTLTPYLQKRILKLWITQNCGSCRSSEAYLKELLRFLSSKRGGVHIISQHWSLIKKQNKAQCLPNKLKTS